MTCEPVTCEPATWRPAPHGPRASLPALLVTPVPVHQAPGPALWVLTPGSVGVKAGHAPRRGLSTPCVCLCAGDQGEHGPPVPTRVTRRWPSPAPPTPPALGSVHTATLPACRPGRARPRDRPRLRREHPVYGGVGPAPLAPSSLELGDLLNHCGATRAREPPTQCRCSHGDPSHPVATRLQPAGADSSSAVAARERQGGLSSAAPAREEGPEGAHRP